MQHFADFASSDWMRSPVVGFHRNKSPSALRSVFLPKRHAFSHTSRKLRWHHIDGMRKFPHLPMLPLLHLLPGLHVVLSPMVAFSGKTPKFSRNRH